MMKKLNSVLVFLLMSVMLSGQSQLIDKVVAQVGSELILLSDVEDRFNLMKERQGNIDDNAYCFIIESLMASKLLVNQSIIDSVIVSDVEVEGQLDARMEQILTYMGGDESQFEAYYGATVEELKDQQREPMREQIVSERMRSTILEKINITPSEVIEFFNSVPKDSLPYYDSEVELSEIVYKPKINEEEKNKAIEKITELRKRIIEGGENFEELAAQYSDEPGASRSQGDLGWQKRGNLVPEFEAAAYRLEANEISEVVETDFGFHIIKMIERRGNTIHVKHILIIPEITEDDLTLAQEELKKIAQEVRLDSLDFGLAVKRYSDKDQQSYHNGGRMVNNATGNTFYEIGDLDTDIYFALDTMEVEQISGPVAFQDQRGNTLYRIIYLQSRTNPHQANLKEDYSKIQKVAKDSKKNEYFVKWVTEKLGETFINFDARYDVCPNMGPWMEQKSKNSKL